MKEFMMMLCLFAGTILLISCGEESNDKEKEWDSTPPTGMVTVPAGDFMMGCDPSAVEDCSGNQGPYHKVTLSAYHIDKYEVAVADYQKCIDAGACNNDDLEKQHYGDINGGNPCNLGVTGKETHPMNCVTWYGANAYCAWADKRLPTEAEWEKAARGADGRLYPWGNEAPTCEYCVMGDAVTFVGGCGSEGTMPVGSKEKGKSPYGLYDMSGNLFEWVNDWWANNYEGFPSKDPQGPSSGPYRVFRGGNYADSEEEYLTTTFRSPPMSMNLPGIGYGFRCAK